MYYPWGLPTVAPLSACIALPILNAFYDPHALKVHGLVFTTFYMHLAYAVG